ncbi:hypothetical protein [Rathayibacter sp. VKM Ac-2630]|nr:hypothetical protein [Rathayibacter sp. VKM Ac-2630]
MRTTWRTPMPGAVTGADSSKGRPGSSAMRMLADGIDCRADFSSVSKIEA